MDRLSQLRGEAGGSRDSTLDTTSPPSEAFMTANESSSKYYSLSEVDSTFDISSMKDDISSIKDVSLANTTTESEGPITNADELISNLSPIGKKSDILDSYKIDTQIEAANILSGGVAIFDDNDNSYDGHELVIDDNVDVDEKSNSEMKQPESLQFKTDENIIESSLISEEADIASKDTEVVLQIDGKNVDAIDIGNGLYLYRKEGQEELAAVQIIDDDQQQPSFKFLKVRENAEGNLEVYEEIEIEVPKQVPAKEGKVPDKNTSSHVPIKDINKVISDSACSKAAERKIKTPRKEPTSTTHEVEIENKEISPDSKSEVNLNGKMMKFNESRKSPVIGSFTPMTYHSTPNKEGIPLTKTMVDQQLHPNRHSDLSNVKKTIEVHTDSCKQKLMETPTKNKDVEGNKLSEISSTEKEIVVTETSEKGNVIAEEKGSNIVDMNDSSNVIVSPGKLAVITHIEKSANSKIIEESITPEQTKDVLIEQDNAIDSTDMEVSKDKSEESIQVNKVSGENKDLVTVVESNTVQEDDALAEENAMVIDEVIIGESVEDKEAKLAITEVNSVSKPDVTISQDEDEEESMEIDEDAELIIVDTVPTIEEEKTIDKDNNPDDQQETKQVEIVKEKRDKTVTDDSIVIKNDDVIEEVIVESKKIKENLEVVSDSKNEIKLDDNKKIVLNVPENVPSLSKDVTVEEITEETNYAKANEKITGDSISAVQPQPKKDIMSSLVVQPEGKKDVITTSSETQNKPLKDIILPAVIESSIDTVLTLPVITKPVISALPVQIEQTKDIPHPVQNEPIKNSAFTLPVKNKSIKDTMPTVPLANEPLSDTVSSCSLGILNTNVELKTSQQENKDVSRKPLYNEPKHTGLLRKMVDGKSNNKPTESLEIKISPPKENIAKHDIPANVSPLLEQKQQSLIAPKVIPEKVKVLEKIQEKKHLPIVPLFSKTAEHKIEKSSRKEPVKVVQIMESQPIGAQVQAGSSASLSIAQVGVKDKPLNEVSKTVKIQKNVIAAPPIKNVALDKPYLAFDANPKFIDQRQEKKEVKLPPKEREKGKSVMNIEITKVPKLEPAKAGTSVKPDISTSSKGTSQTVKNKIDPKDKKEIPKVAESKPINNNHAAVPFGKWTEANKQEFLNKFKTKASVASSNSNQLKNSNDLNRRDVLKKIDSQRQSSNALSKTQDASKMLSMKTETAAFSNKPNIISKESNKESKISQKTEAIETKPKVVAPKNTAKVEVVPKAQNDPSVQNIIDITVEGMIHRSAQAPKVQDESKQITTKEASAPKPTKSQLSIPPVQQASLDEIEMKMNELHGIPFIERPAHELPQVYKSEPKSYSKTDKEKPAILIKTKIPNLLPFPNKTQPKLSKDSVIEVDSEDEIIEHEPITGDIDLNKKNQILKPPAKEMLPSNINPQTPQDKPAVDAAKKEAFITEKDFDKFARRNSITYENCLTVKFDGREPHNVIQTVVEKDPSPKNYSRNEPARVDSKAKLPYKYQNVRPNTQPAKVQPINKFGPATDDTANRNQSKLQKAYHSALTAKRQMASDCPITIIEDKPVKVVFMDNADYIPSQLNVQGQDLSPVKKPNLESDLTVSTCDSLESDLLDAIDDAKSQDEVKIKTKHQRKQVLTPVDVPELELIEPRDLGIEVSPKKKRKTDDDKIDKNLKYPMRKKFYLLNSSAVTEEKVVNPVEIVKNPLKETVNLNDNGVAHKNPVSALDSLVKAAELIETQTENVNTTVDSNSDSQPNTPVKRGRGRPRKYPLTPEGTIDKHRTVVTSPSPQKKPRLIDAKQPKRDTISDDSDSDGEIIKENWTMGKINENIVCPICHKLFRTENVVFKHVKHCTGPSPSRSDSDKRSPRRMRISQDFDTKSRESKSDDMDIDDDKPLVIRKETPKKRKSKDSISKSDDKDDIIVIEDTPVKEKPEHIEERKLHESRKPRTKITHKSNDLVCEFCGKTFRQLSYLVSHKLQHKKVEKTEPKKTEKDAPVTNKSVYSCEVCKKEFRKLHHLVQHRIIHNPSSVPARSSRKSSSEHSEPKVEKEPSTSKQNDDPSAGFRCEPCDKSFRKLHHLVEHRETHDGINRQKTTTVPPNREEKVVEKPVTLHQCDVCKKTFRNLQHLAEHKEQHVETSSEKSDDKSVKSSLSTKDIIHECSLCYMVFPNEHSLNKHTVFCQRKKRQSKQIKPSDETEGGEEMTESPIPEEKIENIDSPKLVIDDTNICEEKLEIVETVELPKEQPPLKKLEVPEDIPEEPVTVLEKEKAPPKEEVKAPEPQVPPVKRDFVETETTKTKVVPEVPEKIKKIEEKKEPVKVCDTPKKKTPVKDKTTSATKRLKTTATPAPVVEDVKPAIDSSDEDEIRYMFNPNFKPEEVTEEKVFMKVRAKKRSSLQIERPNSKDLVKRRTSLQHPPKIPRLKAKAAEAGTSTAKKEVKIPKSEPAPSTDSDDSETTKYSFPLTIPEKPTKSAQDRTPKDSERKIKKKSLADKRKSLSGIAKRKSLGKAATPRHKASPTKQVKKRTLDVEHRCDCGQLFSSAALLSRHTTLAHTPPRIRRRRSPPPDPKPIIKPAPRKSSAADKPKRSTASRKSSARSDSSASTSTKPTKSQAKTGRKSSDRGSTSASDAKKTKSEKAEATPSVKPRRAGAHRGVPVPDKMRKLMHKNK